MVHRPLDEVDVLADAVQAGAEGVPHVVPPLAQPEGFPVVANHMVGERIAPPLAMPLAVVPLGFEGEDELGVVPFLPLKDQGDRFSDRDDVNLASRASGRTTARAASSWARHCA